MTYQEYKISRQKEADNLPIFYVFNNNQLKEEMEKRGLTINDIDKIHSLGFGAFCLCSDMEKVIKWFNTPDPIDQLMENPEFAEDAFYYEMGNHEYHINHYQGDWEVCSCFGECIFNEQKTYRDYLKEIGYSENVIQAFEKTKTKFWNDAIKNDWF